MNKCFSSRGNRIRWVITTVGLLTIFIMLMCFCEPVAKCDQDITVAAPIQSISIKDIIKTTPTVKPTDEIISIFEFVEFKEPKQKEIEAEYKEEIVEYICEYTDEEKEIIAKIVNAESRGECFEGQVAVAQVVINRFKSGKFGNSIKRVAYANSQFANSRKYTDENMKAVEEAISNSPFPDNMYYFRKSKSKHWRSFKHHIRIGNHSFYVDK